MATLILCNILWDGVLSIGQMALGMKANGLADKLMVGASYSCLTETLTKVNGKMTKLLALDVSHHKLNVTSVSGKMMFIMDKVKSFGKTARATLVLLLQVKRMDMESTSGQTKLLTREVG